MKINLWAICFTLILLVGLVVILLFRFPHSQRSQIVSNPTPTPESSSSAQILGIQTKFTNCQAQSGLPDKACTPGAIFLDVTKDNICSPGYSKSVRDVPTSVKEKVYSEYGVSTHKTGDYEVDHLISLELGGSNDISNLWPEAASPEPGFHEKDKVENYLHNQVCLDKMTLQQAQTLISKDWLEVYNSVFY